jgi:ectoine hydroxylase-related dioxygenase (phytanoyl-CoA dioxygenase family)
MKYDIEQIKSDLHQNGLVIIPGFFDPSTIQNLHESAKAIFQLQFDHFQIKGEFLNNMQTLFNDHLDVFISCGKMIQQGLVELYQLGFHPDLVNLMKEIGLELPTMCTRPVLFFNHPTLAKSEHFYKTPLHQDWGSMLSSSDSLVVWLPLIDVDPEIGSVIFYPGSHLLGPLKNNFDNGFAEVDFDRNLYESVQPSLKMGDIVLFSTLLVHESGEIKNNQIRWSCHFRYTNMKDKTFIENGFPHPYVYKPSQELIDNYLNKFSK